MQPTQQIETIAVHAGRQTDSATGAVTPPIHPSTTFERAADGSYPHGYVYTRSNNPNRAALETALAQLEGGASGLAFASGLAAASAVLMTLSQGDHIIIPEEMYHGARHLIEHIVRRWGVTHTAVDLTSPDRLRRAITPSTRLVWVETPSNPRLLITDIAAAAEAAHEVGALCVVDNTWATPLLQRPLGLGADIVLHSATKYLGGHSDLLSGALVLARPEHDPVTASLREAQNLAGAVPSPFDCWLLLRSLSTLPLRVRAQSESAAVLAGRLQVHPAVERVHYPGLADHPGAEVAARQMRGFGGMLSFEVRGGAEAAMRLASALQLITQATSLGGVESLIEHRASVEGPGTRTPQGLLRLSTGLEHVEDLWADLQQALEESQR